MENMKMHKALMQDIRKGEVTCLEYLEKDGKVGEKIKLPKPLTRKIVSAMAVGLDMVVLDLECEDGEPESVPISNWSELKYKDNVVTVYYKDDHPKPGPKRIALKFKVYKETEDCGVKDKKGE